MTGKAGDRLPMSIAQMSSDYDVPFLVSISVMKSLRRPGLLLLLVSFVATSGVPFKRPSDARREVENQTQYSIDDNYLNGLQNLFRTTLAKTEKEFIGQTGHLKGFGAGATYPQIWLRDSATAIPVTRYYYPSEYLTSWIEEHLAHQNRDGSLNDWIAGSPKSAFLAGAPHAKDIYRSASSGAIVSADKNTSESDQETSAVDAAYQVFKINGDRKWLAKNIAGQSLIRRLDLSLAYLLKARFDRRHGLIKNAFTADWGDVSPVYDDQRAIYLDAKTPVVAGLYTNVLFYRAASQIGEIYRALGSARRAVHWQKIALTIKDNINKFMWQEQRGFYRLHIPIAGEGFSRFDDSNMFAMGSNGLAALYGVADDTQAARIFSVASERERAFGVSTIAGVLLPPYRVGFFRHPAVREEYYYQNGGQWDWFAGRLLLAEFERGDAGRAAEQLVAIAQKAVANDGLFEWHTRDGKGMGSPNYLGSAGALSGALFQGLLGVYLTSKSLNLRIRLRETNARLSLHQPATHQYVTYVYQYDAASEVVRLTFESNTPSRGNVCVLLPRELKSSRLLVDAAVVPFHDEMVGDDQYMCFASDWHRHVAEFQLSAHQVRANSPAAQPVPR